MGIQQDKKRNPADLTGRNLKALKNALATLKIRVKNLEAAVFGTPEKAAPLLSAASKRAIKRGAPVQKL